jgi:hypothetical protein
LFIFETFVFSSTQQCNFSNEILHLEYKTKQVSFFGKDYAYILCETLKNNNLTNLTKVTPVTKEEKYVVDG